MLLWYVLDLVPGGQERWRCISPGRPGETCRRTDRWRGGGGWTPWCAEVAGGSPADISAVTDWDLGKLPGPPRTDWVAACGRLKKTNVENLFDWMREVRSSHLLRSLSSAWCGWRTPRWPWWAWPFSSWPSSRTPPRRDISHCERSGPAWRHCSQPSSCRPADL